VYNAILFGAVPAPEPLEPSAAVRVLIVDDNEDSADMLAEALAAVGFQTRRALDGLTALGVAQEFRPAVVLLDIGLPGMDGYEVARRIRDHPELNSMKLVAVTGYGQARDHAKTSLAGFDAHLVKPVDLSQLITLLKSLAL
jgi:CheY-like chemotaxis protein